MAASIKSSSSASASGSNIQRKFSGNKRATDDESSSSPSMRQKSSSASASGSNIRWKYDVFLSFRGEDTRNSFTDHLYTALKQKGICTFRDFEGLERGKEILSKLLEAIDESRFSIVILSKDYASSPLCLEELSKIVECMNSQKHTVFTIFYKVDPSHVRKLKGIFKKAFDKHKKDFKDNPETVKRWRLALQQVGKAFGWHLKDGSEAKLIKGIVGEFSRTLINLRPSAFGDQLVGIESRVKEIDKLLEHELDDRVTFVGICGMGGIGKTTIARVVYERERLSNKYEGCCFLANVREISSEKRGVVDLQQMLLKQILHEKDLNICDSYDGISLIRSRLCKKKVFLVLDDVDQLEQLEQLAGKNDWFGPGSKIVITTRDERVLVSHGIKNRYRVQGLVYDDAKSLFHLKAFKSRQQTTDYVELSKDAIRYADGLPLALEVLGSFLCDRSVDQWKSALERLREVPEEKIMKILRISYDGLRKKEMEIFLDIACFFKGKDKDRTMEILNCCDFYLGIGLEVLIERSLITIVDNVLHMHDLVQEMGWEVVRQQHPKDPGKWSRLWVCKNVYQVLAENMGTPSVEAIIPMRRGDEITHLKLTGKSFLAMRHLRLLIINDVDIHLFEDLEYLSNELRYLEWHGYPLKSLPSSFQPQILVHLILCYSRIEYIWKDIKPSMEYLKIINLSFSYNLIKTPNFEMIPNLERLDLQCCTKLCEVHKSVGSLGKLIVLNLKECRNLVVFPSDVRGLKSLKILNLNGCLKLHTLLLNLEEVEPLEELDISGTAIEQNVLSSIAQLKNLKILSLRGCKVGPPKTWSFSLRSWLTFPARKTGSMGLMLPSLAGLPFLRNLDVSDCNLLEIPSDIGSLFSLEGLNLSGNNFVSLPDSISQLSRLYHLSLEKCQSLQWLPKLPPKIVSVNASDCTSLKTISSALELTSENISMYLFNCFQLVEKAMNSSLEILLLKRFLEINEIRSEIPELVFHLHLPGSEIPELFSYRAEGSSITWPPSHCLLNDELIGFCVCAVMSIPERSYNVLPIMCRFGNLAFAYPRSDSMGDDHLWIAYISANSVDHSPDWFGFHGYKSNMVKRCGIRPVYRHDVEYLKELSATTDGAITMPSTLQGSRFIRCNHCIKKEINADYSEDSSVEEGETGTAVGDIGN